MRDYDSVQAFYDHLRSCILKAVKDKTLAKARQANDHPETVTMQALKGDVVDTTTKTIEPAGMEEAHSPRRDLVRAETPSIPYNEHQNPTSVEQTSENLEPGSITIRSRPFMPTTPTAFELPVPPSNLILTSQQIEQSCQLEAAPAFDDWGACNQNFIDMENFAWKPIEDDHQMGEMHSDWEFSQSINHAVDPFEQRFGGPESLAESWILPTRSLYTQIGNTHVTSSTYDEDISNDSNQSPTPETSESVNASQLVMSWHDLGVASRQKRVLELHNQASNYQTQDGLYHCPWEGQDECKHGPNRQKYEYRYASLTFPCYHGHE